MATSLLYHNICLFSEKKMKKIMSREKSQKEIIINDEDVIRRILDGDSNAYEQLLRKYKAFIFTIVKKHVPYDLVEELAHEIFVKAYYSLSSFTGKGGFKNWLSSIAVRTCYDFWRKYYRKRELPMSSLSKKQQDWLEATLEDMSQQSFHEKGWEHDVREILDWALDRLSAEERIVLELIYLEGLSGKETSKLLGWSVANVRIRAFRARRKLQELLTDMTETSEKLTFLNVHQN